MKILACLLVALCVVGCVTPDKPRPKYDTPYPIPELIDPVTEQPVRTR